MKPLLAIFLIATPLLLVIAIFTHHAHVWTLGSWILVLLGVYAIRSLTTVGGE